MKHRCPACSFEFTPTAKKRSLPAHRRYFAMIGATFVNWPERHPYQPIDAEALRIYLQMEAGWATPVKKNGETYLIPLSIAFEKMREDQFQELAHRVSRIIGENIGVTGNELLEEHKQVA